MAQHQFNCIGPAGNPPGLLLMGFLTQDSPTPGSKL